MKCHIAPGRAGARLPCLPTGPVRMCSNRAPTITQTVLMTATEPTHTAHMSRGHGRCKLNRFYFSLARLLENTCDQNHTAMTVGSKPFLYMHCSFEAVPFQAPPSESDSDVMGSHPPRCAAPLPKSVALPAKLLHGAAAMSNDCATAAARMLGLLL